MKTTRDKQEQLFRVSGRANRKREVDAKWAWTEAVVWSERMVETLERGVQGGKWHSLIDKVYAPEALEAAWQKVERNGGSEGVDGERIRDFKRNAGRHLGNLSRSLAGRQYEPNAIRRVYIPKVGTEELRPLGIPTVRDRIVQTALRNAIEPIFEKRFSDHSYGFRPGKSTKDALRHVQRLLDEGRTWVVDVDITKYFDTIPHAPLIAEVKKEIADGRVIELIERYLRQRVLESSPGWEAAEAGTPQGAVISPLLANIYLHPVDETMEQESYEMVRYADDCVVMCATREEAERAMTRLDELMRGRGLQLHPGKTKIVDSTKAGGFDFLGYHFELGKRTPRKKSVQKLKDKIRKETRRSNGRSMAAIITTLNPILRGWFEYFKHCRHRALAMIDGWVRRRLRSILKVRSGRRGIARGADYQRWPNAHFQRMGLFSLQEAHIALIHSLKETHQPESRMREIRSYGSEGGGAGLQLSLPL